MIWILIILYVLSIFFVAGAEYGSGNGSSISALVIMLIAAPFVAAFFIGNFFGRHNN